MKLKNSGRVLLALVVSLGLGFGLTSCANDYTVGYLYVTGTQYNQLAAYKIANNTGNLLALAGTPYGSGGTNPVRALVSTTGRYLYVLNEGAQTPIDNGPNFKYTGENISVFSIGGNGVLTFQQSYQSQGYGSFRMAFNPTGSYLYVLDEYSPADTPASTGIPVLGSNSPLTVDPSSQQQCKDSSGVYHPTGDITVFAVDSNTGRLSLVTNNQIQTSTGAQLPYFPVGCMPLDLKVTGGYALTADSYDPVTGNQFTIFPYALNASTGQLTTTQNTEFVTGASSISALGSDQGDRYIYVLDPKADQIYYFTIGSGGLLQAVTGSPTSNVETGTQASNPVQLISDNKSKFLYVANAGPSTGIGQVNSDISAFTIASNGVLAPLPQAPFPTGSGPQCIVEDPSNQYLYTADFNSGTVTGHVLDPSSGVLTDMRKQSTYPTVGHPTWCVVDGHTD